MPALAVRAGFSWTVTAVAVESPADEPRREDYRLDITVYLPYIYENTPIWRELMKMRTAGMAMILLLAIAPVIFAADRSTGEIEAFQGYHYGDLDTYMDPNPIVLWDLPDQNLLRIYFSRRGLAVDAIDLQSVRVNGKIAPYSGPAQQEGGWLVTDCFFFRFIALYRPMPPDGFTATYTVEFDVESGEHIEMEGTFELRAIFGDVNIDGVVNVDDVVFFEEYLYHDGPSAMFPELMDLNGDGDIDLEDLALLIELIEG
jgi:hypothetical protein